MFSKDDTLMWGGGKRTEVPSEITEQMVYNMTDGLSNVTSMAGEIDDLIMPDPENVPDHVLGVIRPLLITYGAGGSAEAGAIRKSIIRYGYGEALPEWFSEANYSGHVPKHDVAHLIYEMFYYAITKGPIECQAPIPPTKGRVKHLVLKLSDNEDDYYLHLAKGRRETVDGVNTDVFDFPIDKQINRHELPEAIRDAFKKQAITVQVDGVTEHDGKLHPTGITQLNLKAGQDQVISHSLEIMPEIAPAVLQTNTDI